jgi:hypothetical protein
MVALADAAMEGRAGKAQVILLLLLALRLALLLLPLPPQVPCVVVAKEDPAAPPHVKRAAKDTEGGNAVEDASRVRFKGRVRGAMVGVNPVMVGRGV